MREIFARITADRTPYISQQLEQVGDHHLSPRVEQLDDIESLPEAKHAEDDTRPSRIRKCVYADLSERSMMGQVDLLPDNPRQIQRAREEY